MKIFSKIKFVALLLIILVQFVFVPPQRAYAAQSTVSLGTAAPFAILAGTPVITDSPTSSITGNVGLSPRTSADIGLWCSQMTGLSTIYGVDAGYTGGGHGTLCFKGTAPDKTLVDNAQLDLTTAYDDAAGRTATTVDTELGGQHLYSGVYDTASTALQITAGAGALVLDAQNDASAVFIFEASDAEAGALTVGSGGTVSLINGAQACNVFWRVYGATIDTTAVFKGNILALTSITVANGANIEGRLLARNGQVTLINDTITAPVCTVTSGSGSVTPKLPNTGSEQNTTSLWAIGISSGIIVVLLSFIIAQRKRVI